MPIICWGNLAKSADDTQRIEQAMMGYVEGHDENPNAHMGPDYALGAHRLSVMLDHAPYSVRNLFIYPQARTYKAIVDPTGESDFTTLQAAINYVNSLGGGSILVKAGTYTLSADLILYSNIELLGEDDDLVLIKFASTSYDFKFVGTSGTHKRNLTISGINFESSSYLNGWKNIEVKYAEDVIFDRCKFTDNGLFYGYPYSVFVELSERVNFYNCRSISAFTMVKFLNSSHCKVQNCYGYLGNSELVCIDSSDHIVISENLAVSMGVNVVYDNGNSDRVKVINNTIIDSGDYGVFLSSSGNWIVTGNHFLQVSYSAGGIYLDGGQRNIIANNEIIGTDGDGIHLSNSDHNSICGNVIYGNVDYGIDISDAGSNRNEVVGNQVYNNTAGQIHDVGTNTDQGHNQIVA